MERGIISTKIWDEEYSTLLEIPSSKTFRPSSSFREYIRANRNKISKWKVLDIGCGNGRNSFFALENGFEQVRGFDASKVAVYYATKRARRLNLNSNNYSFYVSNLTTTLPEKSNYFDLAIDMTTSHLLPPKEFANMLSEVHRVLKTGGEFLIYAITSNKVKGREVGKLKEGKSSSIRYYRHDYTHEAEKHGFKIILKDEYTSTKKIGNIVYDRRYQKLILMKG